MVRRIADFLLILIFVWACMLLGLWIIESYIVPLNIHPALLSNIAKPTISVLLVLSWFWLWRKIVRRVFWNALKRG
jgi:hypothetical protein